ncbi:MAG: dienelactone hydrolase family protein [Croceibacterium sp.]
MCDQDNLAAMNQPSVNRRQFAKLGAIATLAACTPLDGAEAATGLTEAVATFDAPGGKMDTYFVYPAQGKHPAVILWPDIAGLRDVFMSMGRRLAREGYAVLILNPYYRDAPSPQFDDFDDFRTNGGMDKVGPWREKLTADAIKETATAVIGWLDLQDQVDTSKAIGSQGYCMAGGFTVWTAAAAPERVKAAASFHGAALVSDDPTSPAKMLGQTQASFLFAIAKNDDARAPGDKTALKNAAMEAGRPAEVAVYRGDHGWTVADSPAYDDDAAEKAWDRLLNLYSTTLA